MKTRYLDLREKFQTLEANSENRISDIDQRKYYDIAIQDIGEYFRRIDPYLHEMNNNSGFDESLNEIDSAISSFNLGISSRNESRMIDHFKIARNRSHDAIRLIK